MPERFGMTPSQLRPETVIAAVCLTCGGHRYVLRSVILAKLGDVPLNQVEPLLKCIERPRLDRRARRCGGAMELELRGPPVNDRAEWGG
jgi:hypothetical protein